MTTLRAVLVGVLALGLVGPAWAAEAKVAKKPEPKPKAGPKPKADPKKAAQKPKPAADSSGESTDMKVEGLVLRGIQHQMVEMREYSGLELKNQANDEIIKLLVPFIEDATTKRLSVDREKLDQLARLRAGATIRVTYSTDKDWNWIRSLEVVDDGLDDEKDQAKDKKKTDNKNNNTNRNRNNNRNRRRSNNDRNRGVAAKPQGGNQAKPSGPAPNPSNMKVPHKITPGPMKIN